MFRRKSPADFDFRDVSEVPPSGALSLGAVLTGVLVAVTATWLLAGAAVAGLSSIGFDPIRGVAGERIDEGVASGIAFAAVTLLGALWGGYTAGRMARTRGGLNGALVAALSLVVSGLAASAVALGSVPALEIPAEITRLSRADYFVNWRLAIEIAVVAAVILGAVIGGVLGARWHRRFDVVVDDRIDRSFDQTGMLELRETVPNPK
ncbi:MAG: hypothetical protein ACRDJ4_07630 [Actinomycetota bacterium]